MEDYLNMSNQSSRITLKIDENKAVIKILSSKDEIDFIEAMFIIRQIKIQFEKSRVSFEENVLIDETGILFEMSFQTSVSEENHSQIRSIIGLS